MSSKDTELHRRSFLKLGLGSLAGLSIGPAALQGKKRGASGAVSEGGKMIYRTLGKTGFKLPIVSMGVMNADNPNLVAGALDSGIIMLDTAWSYQRGKNEKMVGDVIKDRPRDSYVVATKVPWERVRKTGHLVQDADPQDFTKKFDESLKRLGLDYVDIFYSHNVVRAQDTTFEPVLKLLEDEKKRGRAKFVGVTTHRGEPEVIQAAIDSKVYDVVLTAYNFKKGNVAEIKAKVAKAAQAGLGVVAMKTQAGVYWDKEKTDPINMTAALKYVLNDPNVHTAIPGFTTFDQMNLDLSVMEDLTLTEKEIQDLRLEEQTGGLYCQQCDSCLTQCPRELPVPEIMRSYMYAYGYNNLEKAHSLISSLDLADDPCRNCTTCSVQCAKDFDVKDRIQDISRLKAMPSDFFV